jgi:two-component system LytT family response regulator
MFTCMIVDDQPEEVDVFRGYIERTSFLSLWKVYVNPIEALKEYETDFIDLLFLRLNMKKMPGNDFVERLKEKLSGHLPRILFISDQQETKPLVYEQVQTDYLQTPFTFREFETAMKRLLDPGKVLLPGLDDMDFFFADSAGKKLKINFSDIYYVEAAGNYVTIVSRTGKFTIYKSMHEMESLLPVNYFLRIHKSYICALSSIHAITKNEVLLLVEGKTVSFPIGLTYKESLLKKLKLD